MPRRAKKASATWLLLILTVPGRQAALRVRIWRKLRALGAAALRDGVYLAPSRPALREVLEAQMQEVIAAGGTARLLEVSLDGAEPRGLFDRSEEYRALADAAKAALPARDRRSIRRAAAAFERLRREFEATVRRDFFPGPGQGRARRALDEFKLRLERLRVPDEPHAVRAAIPRLDRSQYLGRTWVTREHPWVDRLGSAWLIRRFIDTDARIRWLRRPPKEPDRALGFDYDGATFTHVGENVTFEVLLASFGLDHDPALRWLGSIVHYLDVGGFPVPESTAVEAALRGMKTRARNDDELASRASVLFDDLYAGHDGASQPSTVLRRARSVSGKSRR